jgi:hypothetical protein
MTRTEHLLVTLAEEPAEITQRVTKAMRFGPEEIQPGQPLTNAERIRQEIWDLLGVYGMLTLEGVLPEIGLSVISREAADAIAAKKAKVEEYLRFSAARGLVEGVAPTPGYAHPESFRTKPLTTREFKAEYQNDWKPPECRSPDSTDGKHNPHPISNICRNCGIPCGPVPPMVRYKPNGENQQTGLKNVPMPADLFPPLEGGQ